MSLLIYFSRIIANTVVLPRTESLDIDKGTSPTSDTLRKFIDIGDSIDLETLILYEIIKFCMIRLIKY